MTELLKVVPAIRYTGSCALVVGRAFFLFVSLLVDRAFLVLWGWDGMGWIVLSSSVLRVVTRAFLAVCCVESWPLFSCKSIVILLGRYLDQAFFWFKLCLPSTHVVPSFEPSRAGQVSCLAECACQLRGCTNLQVLADRESLRRIKLSIRNIAVCASGAAFSGRARKSRGEDRKHKNVRSESLIIRLMDFLVPSTDALFAVSTPHCGPTLQTCHRNVGGMSSNSWPESGPIVILARLRCGGHGLLPSSALLTRS